MLLLNRLAALPTRNFSVGRFEEAEAVSGEAFHGAAPSVREACAACTIGCEHGFPGADGKPVRLEYEGLFAMGPLCGISDRDAILEAARRCDRHEDAVLQEGQPALVDARRYSDNLRFRFEGNAQG